MSNKRYYESQISRLELSEIYKPTIRLAGVNGTKTNYMDISNEQLEQIKQILIKGAEK
jgi:hypothetical protein